MQEFLCCVGGWILFSFLMSTITSLFNVRVKLGKPKRFENKKTPIYRLHKYMGVEYRIYKSEQAWIPSDIRQGLNMGLFPFFIHWEVWRYVEDDSDVKAVSINDENLCYIDAIIPDLGVYYEEEMAWRKKEWNMEHEKDQRVVDTLNKINKEFNDNYIE